MPDLAVTKYDGTTCNPWWTKGPKCFKRKRVTTCWYFRAWIIPDFMADVLGIVYETNDNRYKWDIKKSDWFKPPDESPKVCRQGVCSNLEDAKAAIENHWTVKANSLGSN